MKVGNRRLEGVIVVKTLEDHAPQRDNRGEDSIIPAKVRFSDGQLKVRLT